MNIPDSVTEAALKFCRWPDRDIDKNGPDWKWMQHVAAAVIQAWEDHQDAVDIAAAEAALAEGGDPIPVDEVWRRLEIEQTS